MIKRVWVAAIAVLFLNSAVSAETIYLKNGRKIKGAIVEKTDKQVKVDVEGITLTYYMDEVESIEGAANVSVSAAVSQPASVDAPSPAALSAVPAVSSPASASSSNTGKRDLVLSLIEATGTKGNMDQMLSEVMSQSSPEEAEKLRSLVNIDEIILSIVPVYEKNFTEGELRDLVNFYKSPTGRKFMQVAPSIMQESTKATMDYFKAKLPDQK